MQKNKKNLLVITNGFPDIQNGQYNCHFVYEYVNLVKDNFNQIYVISPLSYIPSWIRKLPFLKKFANDYIEKDYYEIDNIKIYYPKIKGFPFNIFFSSIKIRRGYKAVEKIVSTINFDLIHSHFIFPSGYYANRISKKYKIPYLITSHEGDIGDYLKKNIAKVRPVIQEANKIIAVSKINKDCILESILQITNSVEIINNFIDLEKFNILDKNYAKTLLKIKKEEFSILNVANLITNKKGQLDLIKIAKILKEENKDACIYLIGKGQDEKKITREIKKQHLEKYVRLVGPLNNNELCAWYNAANIFVFPSYYESFGIVQIEALACGTSVVAYENEGSKEVLRGYKNNLIKTGDIERFLKKIEESFAGTGLNSEEKRQERRNYVKDNFSAEKVKQQLMRVYNDLLSRQD